MYIKTGGKFYFYNYIRNNHGKFYRKKILRFKSLKLILYKAFLTYTSIYPDYKNIRILIYIKYIK